MAKREKVMADRQYTVSELAAVVRSKTGSYANVSDDELVADLVKKHPEYTAGLKPDVYGPETDSSSSGRVQAPAKNPALNPPSGDAGTSASPLGFLGRVSKWLPALQMQPGTHYEAMDPAEAARREQQATEEVTDAVGRHVPDAAVPALAAAKKVLVDPFEAAAKAGSDATQNFLNKAAVRGALEAKGQFGGPEYPDVFSADPLDTKQQTLLAEQEKKYPITTGATRAVGGVVGGVAADPRQWPLLFAGGEAVRPVFAKLMSAGFGAQMTGSTIQSVDDLSKNWDHLTPEQRAEKITNAGLTGLFATMSAAHVAGEPDARETVPGTTITADQVTVPSLIARARRGSNVQPQPEDLKASLDKLNVADEPTPNGPVSSNGHTWEYNGNFLKDGKILDKSDDIADAVAALSQKDYFGGKTIEGGIASPEAENETEPPIGPGPGAQTASSLNEVGLSPMQQLTESPLERMKSIQGAIQAKTGYIHDNLARNLTNAEASILGLWDSYRRPPEWTGFDAAIGDWQGARQYNAFQLQKFSGELKNAMPDAVRREAITNYLQAGGDENVLHERAAASKPQFRRGYATALKLSPEEKILANNVRNYLDAQLEEAKRAGLLEQGVQDYVSQIWQKSPEQAARLQALNAASELQTQPFFTRERLFRDYFEGEQKGFQPVSKDVGFLLGSYEQAFGKALADRGLIKQLLNAKASDGRPLVQVSGVGRTMSESELSPETKSHLILPHAKGENAADYIAIDSPAMRRYKWVATDSEGKSIFLEGDVLAHPEVAKKLKNVLTPSAIQNSKIGRAALRLSSEFKSTLLSLSMFHQVQLGVHGLEHLVNPLNLPKLDLENSTQRALIDHGTMVASFDSKEAFSEGLSSSGLINKIPVVGKRLAQYQDYLFKDYLPRLKMSMALHALDRNVKRYGSKLSRDQILRLTADQSNSAFGSLNYAQLGRNRTLQDVLRLTLLAPDFLEARGRFVGQALKPYGREQARALATGAAVMYIGARVLNQLLNGNSYADDPKMAFSVRVKNRTYALRTVQGDLLQLVTKPREFVEHRLNPVTTRPLLEAITGRDTFGRPRNAKEQIGDFAKNVVPIPLQSLTKPEDFDVKESVGKSLGLTADRYRTPAARKAHEFVIKGATFSETTRSPEEQQLMKRYRAQMDAGKFSADQVRSDYKAGKLTEHDARELLSENTTPQFVRDFKRLSLEKSLEVYKVANDEERRQLRPILGAKAKRQLPNRVPAERGPLKQKVQQALSEGSTPAPVLPRMLRAARLSQ
jgi:hypothetical protein